MFSARRHGRTGTVHHRGKTERSPNECADIKRIALAFRLKSERDMRLRLLVQDLSKQAATQTRKFA